MTPTTAEDLWQRLAKVLPQLLRIHVQLRQRDRDVIGTSLPELHGPHDVDGGRQYECTERMTTARLSLVPETNGALHLVAGSIISRLAPPGMVVFLCNTYSEPSEELLIKCDPQLTDQIVAIIQSIEVS